MSSGEEQQCIRTLKTRTRLLKKEARTLKGSFGRSNQQHAGIHRRREDPHSPGRLQARGHSKRIVSQRRHQTQQLLLVDQRVHGGRQIAVEPECHSTVPF